LINLVNLAIGNEDKVIEVGKVNKFFGSLESLKNSPNLSFLTITNTEINQGLEYLPASLKTFSYSSLIDSNYQVKELEEEIKD
jgi:hypothetical protein